MARHKHSKDVQRERDRALRLEGVTKKALASARQHKKAYEEIKERVEVLRKELDTANKAIDKLESKLGRVLAVRGNKGALWGLCATLESDVHVTLRNLVRRSLHPDKHMKERDDVKEALTQLFIILEEEME